jgi:hypothetical protein
MPLQILQNQDDAPSSLEFRLNTIIGGIRPPMAWFRSGVQSVTSLPISGIAN